jgi:hypothetical protein
MIDKRLRNEIAQCKLMISDAESLHFYRSITRFIKSAVSATSAAFGDLKAAGKAPIPLAALGDRLLSAEFRRIESPPWAPMEGV